MKPEGPNQANIDKMIDTMKFAEQSFQSKTFCSAKWLTLHLNLQNGYQNSCHHPVQHQVKVEDILKNPRGLHNTPAKKGEREMMLRGEQPAGCEYCWNIENMPGEHISDRTYKTTDAEWSMPHLEAIREAGADGDINPTYLEVSFSNVCNFKCAYCSPDISSQWVGEIEKHGPYPTSWNTGDLNYLKKIGKFPIHHTEHNPYVEVFWEWWPELYPTLSTFRITGGEPLLSKETWKVLKYIEEHPRPDLNLAINTNMGISRDVVDRLVQTYHRLKGKVKSFEIYTSCEASYEAAEYIRYGMNYPAFMENVNYYLKNTGPDSRINFMVTFNALSIPTFQEFLMHIFVLRQNYNDTDAMNRIPMMISYLRWPPFLSMKIAPKYIRENAAKQYKEFVTEHAEPEPSKQLIRDGKVIKPATGRFYLEEIDQVNRLCAFMLEDMEPNELVRNRKDFGLFVQEYDKRRGTDFAVTFPTLNNFYRECLNGRIQETI